MIRCHRRHAAPVVDAGGDDIGQRSAREIGRRLDIHGFAEQDAGDGDGPQMVGGIGLRRVRHAGVRLGAEILDDDFLDMAVAAM